MASDTATPRILRAIVSEHAELCREHFRVRLSVDAPFDARAGQFVQILCCPPIDASTTQVDQDIIHHGLSCNADLICELPMLRRPFSIGGLRAAGAQCEIDIIGRIVGIGTRWIDALRIGDTVELIGPLGGAFKYPPSGHRALLVAGGVGLPPIRWLGECLRKCGIDCRVIYGAQSIDLLPVKIGNKPDTQPIFTPCVDEFSCDGIDAIITTDDGSVGVKGRVTDALKPVLEREAEANTLHVFACGPEPMLKAVADLCLARGVHCQLALERVMGCGMGTCQSCIVPVKDDAALDGWRYALCCREGPIFDARSLIW